MSYQERFETTYESGQRQLDLDRQQQDAEFERDEEMKRNSND